MDFGIRALGIGGGRYHDGISTVIEPGGFYYEQKQNALW